MAGLAARTQPDLQMADWRFGGKKSHPPARGMTLTPFYPTASDDAEGCFIAEPLRAMEGFGVNSCVIAVQPWHRSKSGSNESTPVARWIRYPCIPGGVGLAAAGAFLYASLISKVRTLHKAQRINLI